MKNGASVIYLEIRNAYLLKKTGNPGAIGTEICVTVYEDGR